MMEKNFKVTVTYTESKDTELEAALNTLNAAKNYQLEVLSKTAPIIEELREQKASAILEQCRPLLDIIDTLDKMDFHGSYMYANVYVRSSNNVTYGFSLLSNYRNRKDKDRIQVSYYSESVSIFSTDRYVEEALSLWNSRHVYTLLKSQLLKLMAEATEHYSEEAQDFKNRVNALIDD